MARIDLGVLELEPQRDVQFVDVSDIALDRAGRLYLLTRAEAAVVIYEPDGVFVGSWRDPHFTLPHGITIDADDVVWIVDQGEHTVRSYSLDGDARSVLGSPGRPSATGLDWSLPRYKDRYLSIRHGGPPFNNPTKLAVGADGSHLVSDGYGNTRVHHFDADGRLLASWGEPGSGPGQFRLPHGVCALADGTVAVADRENDRIQVFDLAGGLVDVWDDVQRPAAVAQLRSGMIAVAELNWKPGDFSFSTGEVTALRPARLSVLDAAGRCVARVTGGGGLADVWRPHGVAVGSDGTMFVAQLGWPHGGDTVRAVVTAHLC